MEHKIYHTGGKLEDKDIVNPIENEESVFIGDIMNTFQAENNDKMTYNPWQDLYCMEDDLINTHNFTGFVTQYSNMSSPSVEAMQKLYTKSEQVISELQSMTGGEVMNESMQKKDNYHMETSIHNESMDQPIMVESSSGERNGTEKRDKMMSKRESMRSNIQPLLVPVSSAKKIMNRESNCCEDEKAKEFSDYMNDDFDWIVEFNNSIEHSNNSNGCDWNSLIISNSDKDLESHVSFENNENKKDIFQTIPPFFPALALPIARQSSETFSDSSNSQSLQCLLNETCLQTPEWPSIANAEMEETVQKMNLENSRMVSELTGTYNPDHSKCNTVGNLEHGTEHSLIMVTNAQRMATSNVRSKSTDYPQSSLKGITDSSRRRHLLASLLILHELCFSPSVFNPKRAKSARRPKRKLEEFEFEIEKHIETTSLNSETIQKLQSLLIETEIKYKKYKEQLRPLMVAFNSVAGHPDAATCYIMPSLRAISIAFRRIKDSTRRALKQLKTNSQN